MTNKRLYIFDLDGTLVDAYRAIERSLNSTLTRLGYPPVSYTKVKRNVGKGDRIFIQTFFPKKDIGVALKLYRQRHKNDLLWYLRLRPSALTTLRALKKRNKLIAIASNRPRYFTHIILRRLRIQRYFDSVLCADQLSTRKPHPKILNSLIKRFGVTKEEAVYAGDMDIDLETARRAHIDAIFVKNGSSTLKDVKRYRDKRVISSLREILHLYE